MPPNNDDHYTPPIEGIDWEDQQIPPEMQRSVGDQSSLFDNAGAIQIASSDPNMVSRLLAQKMARRAGRVGGALNGTTSSSLDAVKRFGGSMGRMLSRRHEPDISPSNNSAFSSSMSMLDIGTFDLYGTLERLRREGGRQWKRGDSELDAAMKDVALETAEQALEANLRCA